MAEGLAKNLFGDRAEIESAGSQPTRVNRFAIQAMKEVGVDISKHFSKTYDELAPGFREDLNFVITLCADEVCPTVISRTAQKRHWPFPDPAGHEGREEEQLARFREIRDRIKDQLIAFGREMDLLAK